MSVIKFTPRGESGEITLDLDDLGGLQRLSGGPRVAGTTSQTDGGNYVRVNRNQLSRYRLSVRAISETLQNGSNDYMFGRLWGFLSHLEGGGEFKFERESGNNADTTMSSGESKGDVAIAVASESGMSVGDWLYLEDADDETKFEVARIASLATLNVEDGIHYSYGAGSIVRHWQYLPACILAPGASVSFDEREAGQGPKLWDLSFQFVEVRS